MRLNWREKKKKPLYREGPLPENVVVTAGVENETKEIFEKTWSSRYGSPPPQPSQAAQFKADSNSSPWAIFTMEHQEERCPLCHSLIVFANYLSLEWPPHHLCLRLSLAFMGTSALNSGSLGCGRAPTTPGLLSSEAQGLETCLWWQKPTLASVVHVVGQTTSVVFMVRIPVHRYLSQDSKLVGKKAILRSLSVVCDWGTLERSFYPQNILCISFLWLPLQVTTNLVA